MEKLTAREAYKLMDELGLGYGMDGTTYYATNKEHTEVWEFDTKRERDDFVRRHN